MVTATATATASEMQNNFERYLTDSLTGILQGEYDIEKEKGEALNKKYEMG